ncbi:TetR family transcriptional regulator [Streptomyces klenkii]|uniref:TetR/AcrR family transcriptional regulator n=1 Tax=Streptomyces klenkii TaxID=1420899 RepID=UPI0033AAD1FE
MGAAIRRRDPQRRIAELSAATEKVIAARGIEGLTHRAIAEEAGVPLGATTYHFAAMNGLTPPRPGQHPRPAPTSKQSCDAS